LRILYKKAVFMRYMALLPFSITARLWMTVAGLA